jgi:hypothetical protein
MDEIVWTCLEHASSWEDVVDALRAYVADGRPDAERFAAVADLVEGQLGRFDAARLTGSDALFPATVLMLHGLDGIRRYGEGYDPAYQGAFIRALIDAQT